MAFGIIVKSGTQGEPPPFMREGNLVEVLAESIEPGTHRKMYAVADITAANRWVMYADQIDVRLQ